MTNRALIDPRYYSDGVVCEAPRKLDSVEAVPEQASSSRWNVNDYHWEERDLLAFARQTLEASLLGLELWRAGDETLKIVALDVDGHCVSNIRKGRRLLTYSLKLAATFHGKRGGAGISAVLRGEMNHDESLENISIEATPTDDGSDTHRAMRTHDLFGSLLRKKGRSAMLGAIEDLRVKLKDKGG